MIKLLNSKFGYLKAILEVHKNSGQNWTVTM